MMMMMMMVVVVVGHPWLCLSEEEELAAVNHQSLPAV